MLDRSVFLMAFPAGVLSRRDCARFLFGGIESVIRPLVRKASFVFHLHGQPKELVLIASVLIDRPPRRGPIFFEHENRLVRPLSIHQEVLVRCGVHEAVCERRVSIVCRIGAVAHSKPRRDVHPAAIAFRAHQLSIGGELRSCRRSRWRRLAAACVQQHGACQQPGQYKQTDFAHLGCSRNDVASIVDGAAGELFLNSPSCRDRRAKLPVRWRVGSAGRWFSCPREWCGLGLEGHMAICAFAFVRGDLWQALRTLPAGSQWPTPVRRSGIPCAGFSGLCAGPYTPARCSSCCSCCTRLRRRAWIPAPRLPPASRKSSRKSSRLSRGDSPRHFAWTRPN